MRLISIHGHRKTFYVCIKSNHIIILLFMLVFKISLQISTSVGFIIAYIVENHGRAEQKEK